MHLFINGFSRTCSVQPTKGPGIFLTYRMVLKVLPAESTSIHIVWLLTRACLRFIPPSPLTPGSQKVSFRGCEAPLPIFTFLCIHLASLFVFCFSVFSFSFPFIFCHFTFPSSNSFCCFPSLTGHGVLWTSAMILLCVLNGEGHVEGGVVIVGGAQGPWVVPTLLGAGICQLLPASEPTCFTTE